MPGVCYDEARHRCGEARTGAEEGKRAGGHCDIYEDLASAVRTASNLVRPTALRCQIAAFTCAIAVVPAVAA